ncbi:hypothetical protein GCM10010377_82920 [Streptomyces viridiviolaceus]|nr:hypothetical protein GCM10010377_82920 [Streptomyces viridiviolaceus]
MRGVQQRRRHALATIDTDPRPGDVAGGYTKSDRAAGCWGWTPTLSLEDGIRSAVDWMPVRHGC